MNEHGRIAVESADRRARFTAREFIAMIDAGAFDDMKVELVRGELERMPPPGSQHANWQIRVAIRLGRVIEETRLFGEVGIQLNDDTLVGCDVAIADDRTSAGGRLNPADVVLVVDVAVSGIGRDLGLKRALYAEAGIACYWVVDPEREVTHVYREPVAGEYRTVATTAFGDPLAIPGTDATVTFD